MKKVLFVAVTLLTCFSLRAAITAGHPAYDPFSDASGSGGTTYAVGSSLINQVNAQGLTWNSAGPTGATAPGISSGNLSISGLSPSSGNSVSYGGTNGDTARLGLGGALNSGTVYYSLAVELTSLSGLTNTGAIIAAFNNSTGTQTTQPTVMATRFEMRLSGTGYNIGLDKSGTGITWDSTVHNVGETVFIVGSYTFNTGGSSDDTTALWINPSSTTFGAASAPSPSLTSSTGSDITSSVINSFMLRETNTPYVTVDEIRAGLTWTDVTPPMKVAPTFSNLSASQPVDYGSSGITVSGTISAPGPVYPTNGESVVVTIDGKSQTNTVNDNTGDFSFTYNPSGIPVTGSPYAITYSYAGDTFLGSATDDSTTLTVNPLAVTLSGSRNYDGTSTAAAGVLSVANVVGSDDVTVASGSATLAGSGAGSETITSLGTLALGGTTAGNYTLTDASGSVNITALPVVLTGTRPYDGMNDASYSILSISNAVSGDDVSLVSGSATLASASSGAEPIVSPGTLMLGGATAGNYTLTGASGTVTITGGTIIVSLAGTRAYDGTSTASYTILTIANKANGDDVNLVSGTAALAGSTPGGETVTSPGSLMLGGAQASKYTLTGSSGAVTITALPVELTGTRLYDGTSNAAASILAISNVVAGDDAFLASGDAQLAGKTAGTEAIASSGTLTLGGTTAGDYTLSNSTGTVTVSPLPVVLTGTRGYDGTASAAAAILTVSNAVSGDIVTVASGSATLAGSNYGPEAITSPGTLELGGAAATNYTLTGASGSVYISFGPGYPVYDPFADASTNGGTSYAVGSPLIGQTNTQGLTWYATGTTGTEPQPVIAAGNLSVAGLAPSTGNSVSYGPAGSGNKGYTARLGLGVPVSSGTLYYSMPLQVTSLGTLPTSGVIIAGFNNSTGSQTTQPGVIGTRLELRLSGSGYNIGLDKSGSGLVWDTATHMAGETVFIVGSYTFNTNGSSDDATQLWIDPPPTSFDGATPPVSTLSSSGGSDISSGQIASFILRQATTTEPPMLVDDVRIGYSWADVTPPAATAPPFQITAVSLDPAGANLIITFNSVSGSNYQIIGSTSVSAPIATWTNVGSAVMAAGSTTSITNPIAPSWNFYKVVSP